MTKLGKQSILVAILFCMLIGIASAPIAMLEYNNTKLMNTPHIEALPLEFEADKPLTTEKHDAFERIKLVKKSDVIVNWQEDIIYKKDKDKLVEAVEEQLLILEKFKALPLLEFSEEYDVIASTKSYMDTKNPNKSVSIRHAKIIYTDFVVEVYFDIETSVLYDISIISLGKSFIYGSDIFDSNGFLEYLEMSSNGTEKDGERFDTSVTYKENSMKLFVISHNDTTQEVTLYNFNEFIEYVTIDNEKVYYK